MKTKPFNIEEWEKGTPAVFGNKIIDLIRMPSVGEPRDSKGSILNHGSFDWFSDGSPCNFRSESGNGAELLLLDDISPPKPEYVCGIDVCKERNTSIFSYAIMDSKGNLLHTYQDRFSDMSEEQKREYFNKTIEDMACHYGNGLIITEEDLKKWK